MSSDPPEPPKPAPTDELFRLVYGELKALARGALGAQRASHTLQPTALVHEAWLNLASSFQEPESRGHFLAVAAKAMRQVLQDHARAQRAAKRGQRAVGVEVGSAAADAPAEPPADLIALDDALSRLAELNERHAKIAELRILGGLTMPEIADEVGVSLRTIETDWTIARAWLRTKL